MHHGRLMKRSLDRALEKYKTVALIVATPAALSSLPNTDEASSCGATFLCLAMCFLKDNAWSSPGVGKHIGMHLLPAK